MPAPFAPTAWPRFGHRSARDGREARDCGAYGDSAKGGVGSGTIVAAGIEGDGVQVRTMGGASPSWKTTWEARSDRGAGNGAMVGRDEAGGETTIRTAGAGRGVREVHIGAGTGFGLTRSPPGLSPLLRSTPGTEPTLSREGGMPWDPDKV